MPQLKNKTFKLKGVHCDLEVRKTHYLTKVPHFPNGFNNTKKNNSCMEFPLAWYQPVDFYADAVTLDGKAEEEATY